LGWRLKENVSFYWKNAEFANGSVTVETNAIGGRQMPSVVADSSLETLRILVLGDSFSFGWGVESGEAYAAVLQSLLNGEGLGLRIAVSNMAVPGYGPEQVGQALKRSAAKLDPVPRVVVVGFTENDFANLAIGANEKVVRRGHLVRRSSLPGNGSDSLVSELTYRSMLFRALFRLKEAAIVKLATGPPAPGPSAAAPRRTLSRLDTIELEIFRRKPSAEVQRLFLKAEGILADIAKTTRAMDAELVVMGIPWPHSVSQAKFEDFIERAGADISRFHRLAPSQRLRTVCQGLGIRMVDMNELLQDRVRDFGTAELYFETDGHWTAQGHRVAGEHLAAEVGDVLKRRTQISTLGQ
ncbi:MAG: GDSL-type esterase/lipase family protein, partial [Acidobacteriota bacterium]